MTINKSLLLINGLFVLIEYGLGLVGIGDGGVDLVLWMSTHFKLANFIFMSSRSSASGPLMMTPSRFCFFLRRDFIDSTRRRNALAPSFRRSLPVRRNRTGNWSFSFELNDVPCGSVENPMPSALFESKFSALEFIEGEVLSLLSKRFAGIFKSVSHTLDHRRFFCSNVQFSLRAYSSSSESYFCKLWRKVY